jgi:hypothetical protein
VPAPALPRDQRNLRAGACASRANGRPKARTGAEFFPVCVAVCAGTWCGAMTLDAVAVTSEAARWRDGLPAGRLLGAPQARRLPQSVVVSRLLVSAETLGGAFGKLTPFRATARPCEGAPNIGLGRSVATHSRWPHLHFFSRIACRTIGSFASCSLS